MRQLVLPGLMKYFNKRLVNKKDRMRRASSMFLPKKTKISKVSGVAARVHRLRRTQDFEVLKRQNCVNDRTDNRRELQMRLYMENNYQSVRNQLHQDEYQGQFTNQINSALMAFKKLNVCSPEVTFETTPPIYTAFASVKVDMHSRAMVSGVKPFNSRVREQPKDHVSVDFIYRPTFRLQEEDRETEEKAEARVWN